MRVESSNFVSDVGAKFGSELPEHAKTGRAAQSDLQENTASGRAASTGRASLAAGEDVVHFASKVDGTASRVEALNAQALSQPEIREAKVQSLQTAIGNGQYSVSPRQIAGALKSELGTDVYG